MPLFSAAASDDGPITYLNGKMVVIRGANCSRERFRLTVMAGERLFALIKHSQRCVVPAPNECPDQVTRGNLNMNKNLTD